MYADFNFYKNSFYGSVLDAAAFTRCATRASSFMDYITQGRIKPLIHDKKTDEDTLSAIKMCCCELAEAYVSIENAKAERAKNGGELQSETVGSYHRSFRSSAETEQSATAQLLKIAKQHLGYRHNLLYRGCSNVHTAHCDSI